MELTHPDDPARDIALVVRLVAGEIDGYSLDKRFIRKGGSVLWAQVSVNRVRRPDGIIPED
jgi:PAS domain S-box-containing protein